MTDHKHLTTGGTEDPFLPVLLDAINGATKIDMSVAFIMSSGMHLIKPALEDALDSGAALRILTGDYLNVSEPQALRSLLLLAEKGAEVRVYEADKSRSFHMKTYIFVSEKDGGKAFVGSSNISKMALLKGLEWNLCVKEDENPERFALINENYEDLYAGAHVCTLTHDWIAAYEERYAKKDPDSITQPGQDEKLPPPIPTPIQAAALDALHKSRERGDKRGLVVMATGLGKTWLAAFDVRDTRSQKVLFVAHREEILQQAEDTFLRIRPSARVGKYTGKEQELEADMIFASIQTLGKAAHLRKFDAQHFDYIIVDEFHHAAARTYRQLLAHFDPKYLLGLTATPDRTDHSDILSFCDNNLVYRKDLYDGIEMEMLCPFHYYGIGDHEVDYTSIPWRNGKFEPEALTNQLATVSRANHVLNRWSKLKQHRTLAFCVSTKHADFMAKYFNAQGIASVSVHSKSAVRRNEALAQLEQGTIDVVFSVDLFNEGVDIPTLDTVLMLRPTESKIIFLQQLGRGLRKAPGKPHLVILDFIGNHISFFRKLESLFKVGSTNQARREFIDKLNDGELELSGGCFVNYDPKALDFMQLLVQSSGDQQLDRYQTLYDSLGRRPTIHEFHQSGGNVNTIRREYGQWHKMVDAQGHLEADEQEVLGQNAKFLLETETTRMTKSFKMVLLEAFLDLDGFNNAVDSDQLAERSFEIMRRRRQLWPDLPENFRQSLDKYSAVEKEWKQYWKQNPVNAWTGGNVKEGFAYFKKDGNTIAYSLHVDAKQVEGFEMLIRELLDFRYQQYEERIEPEDIDLGGGGVGDDASSIPYFSDLRIACGFFRTSEHDISNVQFQTLPLKYGRLDPARHFIAQASGNSMDGGHNPVKDGDYILLEAITPDSAGSISNQVLAVERQDVGGDDQYVLRRVEKIAEGRYNLVANNPDYEDFEATDEMRTFARFKQVIDPVDMAMYKTYSRDQMPGIFGLEFLEGRWRQPGHVLSPTETKDQFFMVTLSKKGKETEYSYHDYFIDSDTFHWQSQNKTTPESKKGQGIINHQANGSHIHLFIRKNATIKGKSAPFYYVGKLIYVSHQGSAPMDVTYKLEQSLPNELVEYFGTRS